MNRFQGFQSLNVLFLSVLPSLLCVSCILSIAFPALIPPLLCYHMCGSTEKQLSEDLFMMGFSGRLRLFILERQFGIFLCNKQSS